MGAPHRPQNADEPTLGSPQEGQDLTSLAPQAPQNPWSARFAAPHAGQTAASPSKRLPPAPPPLYLRADPGDYEHVVGSVTEDGVTTEQMTTDAPTEGFLAELSPKELEVLHSLARRRRYARGSTLFNEGESSDWVVVVLKGRVKVSSFTAEGKEIVLALREPGALLGELAALDGQPRSATVSALDQVEALLISGDDFRAFLQAAPQASLRLLQMLTGRLRDADRKRIEFGANDTVGRVALRLLELAERFGEETPEAGVRISLPLSQEELAGWVGSSREGVNKALRALQRHGWIETHRLRINVLDVEALRRRAT